MPLFERESRSVGFRRDQSRRILGFAVDANSSFPDTCEEICRIDPMKSLRILNILLVVFFCWSGVSRAIIPLPCRFGGNLTVNGVQIPAVNDAQYIVFITRADGTLIKGPNTQAKLGDGKATYFIDIPMYDPTDQPHGLREGDVVIIHVHNGCAEMPVIQPAGGKLIVGRQGEWMVPVNIHAEYGLSSQRYYTQSELDQAVQEAVAVWDANGDGRIGLEEAIRALQIVSNIR